MTRVDRARPRVTIKWAQTLDGRVATSSGHSRWVSGCEARVFGHQLRSEHDAILVGVGTILADDPQLTVRHVSGRDPLRVVVDTRFRTPRMAKVLTDGLPTVVATTVPVDRTSLRGAVVPVIVPARSGRVDLPDVLSKLYERGIRSVLVEGGPTVATSFLRERLADEIVLILAPKVLGTGTDAIGELGSSTMDDAIMFTDATVTFVGEDLVFRGKPVWRLT